MLDAARVLVIAPGRTSRAVRSYRIVGVRIGAECIGRADGDYRWFVAGRMDLPIDLIAVGIFAVVPGGGHHDDAGIDQGSGRATDWIVLVGIDGRRAQAYVHHANVVLVFVQRVRPTG